MVVGVAVGLRVEQVGTLDLAVVLLVERLVALVGVVVARGVRGGVLLLTRRPALRLLILLLMFHATHFKMFSPEDLSIFAQLNYNQFTHQK